MNGTCNPLSYLHLTSVSYVPYPTCLWTLLSCGGQHIKGKNSQCDVHFHIIGGMQGPRHFIIKAFAEDHSHSTSQQHSEVQIAEWCCIIPIYCIYMSNNFNKSMR